MRKKVAIVTGAAGGIGYACAKRLLENGIAVVGMGRRFVMQNPLREILPMCLAISASDADRKKLVDTALQINGALDILVNVAGVAPKVRADLLTMTEESYDYVMDINTKGTFFLTQLAATAMIQKRICAEGQHCQYFFSVRVYQLGQSRRILYFQGRCIHDYKAVCRPSGAIRHFGQRDSPRHYRHRYDADCAEKKYDVLIEDGLLQSRVGAGRRMSQLRSGRFAATAFRTSPDNHWM